MANYIVPPVLSVSAGKDGFAVVLSNGTGNVYLLKAITRELCGSLSEMEKYLTDNKLQPSMSLEWVSEDLDILKQEKDKRVVVVKPLPGIKVENGKLLNKVTSEFNRTSITTLKHGRFCTEKQLQGIVAGNLLRSGQVETIEDAINEADAQINKLLESEGFEILAKCGFKPSNKLKKELIEKAKALNTPSVVSENEEEDE